MKNDIHLSPIGTIYSPFTDSKDMPIQPASAVGTTGKVVLQAQFEEGLKDLEGFSHIILLYYFHLSSGYNLLPKPFLDHEPRGLFATRAPRRPNPIGFSIVRLEKIDGLTLHVSNIDIIDGTPLLDIKPYVPAFDAPDDAAIGWLSGKLDRVEDVKSDDRFSDSPPAIQDS
jgi:tRNA-Thr(GGU) m(6)t(6)A37 methyltransferase TsaA